MKEYVADCLRELIRLEHLVFVSLKYTRTSDILKSILIRGKSFLDKVWVALLENAKLDNKITEYPQQEIKRVNLIKKLYSDDEMIQKMVFLYEKLRRMIKGTSSSESEYRRQLKVIILMDNDEIEEVTIDSVTEMYNELHEFLNYLREFYFSV